VETNDIRTAQRYPFIVDIELTDLQSGIKINAQTKDLSQFGCSIDSLKTFSRGTILRIEMSHLDRHFEAYARVIYASPSLGMGVVFTRVEPEDERILHGWLVQLVGSI
jgi:hypothetical protein